MREWMLQARAVLSTEATLPLEMLTMTGQASEFVFNFEDPVSNNGAALVALDEFASAYWKVASQYIDVVKPVMPADWLTLGRHREDPEFAEFVWTILTFVAHKPVFDAIREELFGSLKSRVIDSGVPLMSKKMQGPDLFNSAEFPTGHFVADRFDFDGDRLVAVQGQLTLLGRSNPVTLSALRFNCYLNPLLKRRTCGGDFDTTIVRSQWGLTWGLDMGMPDPVHLLLQVEAIQQ